MAHIRISPTIREKGKSSVTDRVRMQYDLEPENKPYFVSRYVCESTDCPHDAYWFLADEIHDWFVENDISYKLDFELADWWIEVADDKAIYVKLAMGE